MPVFLVILANKKSTWHTLHTSENLWYLVSNIVLAKYMENHNVDNLFWGFSFDNSMLSFFNRQISFSSLTVTVEIAATLSRVKTDPEVATCYNYRDHLILLYC